MEWRGGSFHPPLSIKERAESLPRGRPLPPLHYSKGAFSGDTGHPCSAPPPALQSLLPYSKYKGKVRADVPGGGGKLGSLVEPWLPVHPTQAGGRRRQGAR